MHIRINSRTLAGSASDGISRTAYPRRRTADGFEQRLREGRWHRSVVQKWIGFHAVMRRRGYALRLIPSLALPANARDFIRIHIVRGAPPWVHVAVGGRRLGVRLTALFVSCGCAIAYGVDHRIF